MNKYEAAYNMMMILSVVDGDFLTQEGDVIVQYLKEMHQPYVGTDEENHLFMELSDEQLIAHFKEASYDFFKQHDRNQRLEIFEGAAREFYEHSLPHDRNTFIEYAKKIIVADHKVSKEENVFINQLFKLWGLK
ncbi:hypothetical protein GC194_15610 [bacterium]|nr:hypothetical protein [bacterium]